MVLIALLVALSIERITQLPAPWQVNFYLSRWLNWSEQKLQAAGHDEKLHHPLLQLLWLLTPAILAGLLVVWLDHLLVTFVCSILALLLSFSCQPARNAYKAYLKAANRGDKEIVAEQQQKLQQLAGQSADSSAEDAISWLNYQYYLAVIFFYIVFGVFGALAYASVRAAEVHYPQRFQQLPLQRLRWAIDFIPVRLAGLGLMLVGHFSQTLPVWLRSLTDVNRANSELLAQFARCAEDRSHHPDDKTEAVTTQLALMKRQQLLWLCVIAVLTLAGALS